jgi:hypothetical protein
MTIPRFSAFPLSVLLTFGLCACATTEGHDRANATALRVEAVGGAAGQTQLRLDQTLDALEQIAATATQDPQPAFRAFSTAFARFQSELQRLASERARLDSTSQTWFAEFQRQNAAIQDPELREQGEQRLADLRARTTDTSARFARFLEATRGFETRLADLRLYLGNDLTPAGIDAVTGRIRTTAQEGRELAADLGELSKSATDLAAPLRAARQPAAVQGR